MKDVAYVPKIAVNLLLVSKIVNGGYTVTFSKEGCNMTTKEGSLIATVS